MPEKETRRDEPSLGGRRPPEIRDDAEKESRRAQPGAVLPRPQVDTDPTVAGPGEVRPGGPAVLPEDADVYLPPGQEHAAAALERQRLKALKARLDAEYERQANTPGATHELAWVEALPGARDTPEDGSRVVLWEDHPMHPGGEIVLAPGHVRLVALTAGVVNKIREGRLKVVDEPADVFDEQPWVAKPHPAATPRHERPKATYRPHQRG